MKNIDSFASYHPVVNFIYFIVVITLTMVYMHPVFLVISLVVSFSYSVYLKGVKTMKFNTFFMLPTLIIVAVLNPFFSQSGETLLFYIGSRPIMLESVVFGWTSAVMLVSIILWFSCYNAVMTSDKFIYIFGRVIPILSLIFSMVLRFVPRYIDEIKKISTAQKCIGKGLGQGGFTARVKNGVRILAVTIAWALEDGIVTSDSMRSRGYGLKGRTSYSIYSFYPRDKFVCAMVVIMGTLSLVLPAISVRFQYFPSMEFNDTTPLAAFAYVIYMLFCMIPIIIDILEDRRWKCLA